MKSIESLQDTRVLAKDMIWINLLFFLIKTATWMWQTKATYIWMDEMSYTPMMWTWHIPPFLPISNRATSNVHHCTWATFLVDRVTSQTPFLSRHETHESAIYVQMIPLQSPGLYTSYDGQFRLPAGPLLFQQRTHICIHKPDGWIVWKSRI